MAGFSPLERSIAQFLARFPGLKAKLKTVYQRGNYILHGEAGFKYSLADGLRLKTPSQLIGLPEPDSETAEFFGYFDASPWSPNGRHYVVHHVINDGPTADIIVYDLEKMARYRVGTTTTWTWQQGAMPRWIMYGGEACLAFNTINDGQIGTRLHSPVRGNIGFLSQPLQAVNETFGLLYSINYLRLSANKTEYGYDVSATNMPADLPMEEDGIWATHTASGGTELIVSLSTLLENSPRPEMEHSVHEVNHISVAPGGKRFVFIHRYRGRSGQFSRLYLANYDGSNLALVLDDDMVSHYTWMSDLSLLVWARTHGHGDRYYMIDMETGEIEAVPADTANRWGDGHPTCHVRSNRIVTDSYPDRKRQQHLFELDIKTFEPRRLADFFLPVQFHGGRRIDLHPRWHPDGTRISVDAGYVGQRRNYILNLSTMNSTERDNGI